MLNKIKNLVLEISKIERIRNKKYKVNKLYMLMKLILKNIDNNNN